MPVITVPTPSDIQASEQSNLNHQMQQIVPPVKQELPSATQPAPPPQDVDVEFSHSLSAQEEISISGGGARQRLMAKLMRESRY